MKIRQEINIINATTASSSTGLDNGSSIYGTARIDTNRYSGTVTYFFEMVAKNGNTSPYSFYLTRLGTTTHDATVDSGSGANQIPTSSSVYKRVRVSFTPPSGITDYFLDYTGSGTTNVRAARIIVTQEASVLNATETQLEIGARVVNVSGNGTGTLNALSEPKYFYFDSSKWDGAVTATADLSYKNNASTMYNFNANLEMDNGSYGSWTNVLTIVSSAAVANVQHVRAAGTFTPTNGRHYRVVASTDSNMGTYDVYCAKVVIQQARGGTAAAEDSYQIAGSNLETTLSSADKQGAGQSFKASLGGSLASCTFRLRKFGSPTGSAYAKLYAHSGTFGSSGVPTGSALATSNTLDVSTVSLTAGDVPLTFSGSNRYDLTKNSNYVITLEYAGGDASNNIRFDTDNGSPTHQGNHCELASSTWSATSRDARFSVDAKLTVVTKLEPQYLIVNQAAAATGLQDYDTQFDPAEWSGVTNAYYHEINGSVSTSQAKLQTDPNGTPADIANSSVTGANRIRSSSQLTMSSSTQTIDTYVQAVNIWGSAIIVQTVVNATNVQGSFFPFLVT